MRCLNRLRYAICRPVSRLVLLSAWVVAWSASVSLAQTEKVTGTVIDSVTHQPIARAMVRSIDGQFAGFTDDRGHFEFEFKPPEPGGDGDQISAGSFAGGAITVRRPGYFDTSFVTTQQDKTVSLVPEGVIFGRVAIPNSDGSERTTVELYGRRVQGGWGHWALVASAVTRSNGDFRFAELEAGSYKVLTQESTDQDPLTFDPQGQLYGYPPAYFPEASDFASASVIQVSAGQSYQANLSPVRKPYHRVKIPIANVPPGANVGVNVWTGGQRGPGFTLGYNRRDQAIEGMLPDGTYAVEALAAGVTLMNATLNITVKGGAFEGPRAVLAAAAPIPVRVTYQFTSDSEAENSQENATAADTRSMKTHRGAYVGSGSLISVDEFDFGRNGVLRPTSSDGRSYEFAGAYQGQYWLNFEPARGYLASARVGSSDLLREPLVVGGGASSAPIELVVRDDFSAIDGVVEDLVKDPDNTSIDTLNAMAAGPRSVSAYVYLIPQVTGSGLFREVAVFQDGTFNDPQVAPGTYRILAFDRQQPDLEWSNPDAMQAYDSRAQVIRVGPGQTEHARLRLVRTGE